MSSIVWVGKVFEPGFNKVVRVLQVGFARRMSADCRSYHSNNSKGAFHGKRVILREQQVIWITEVSGEATVLCAL